MQSASLGESPKDQRKKTIRFVLLSDTHSKMEMAYFNIPEGDVLLHAGDFTLRSDETEFKNFNDCCRVLKEKKGFKEVVVIAGNHEQRLETHPEKFRSLLKDVTYLENSETTVFGYRVYGSPVTPHFCDMGFEVPRGESIKKVWDKIPTGLDFLVTHGPPHKILDWVPYTKTNAGCEELRKAVLERVKPTYHVFGHIHEGNEKGEIHEEGGVTFINAALCSVRYKPTQKIHVLDLPARV